MMTVKFRYNDQLYNKIVRKVNYLNNHSVKVGYIEGARPGRADKGTPKKDIIKKMSEIILIGVYNEFGVSNVNSKGQKIKKGKGKWRIPPRSHVKAGIDKNKKELLKNMDKLLSLVVADRLNPKTAYKFLGEMGASYIKNYMIALKTPKNKPSTIKIKGFDNPLIWAGQLKNTVNYKVVKS